MQRFTTVDDTHAALEGVRYLSDRRIDTAVLLSAQLEKPLLVEGPAGVGKTDLARAMAEAQGRRLIRLQCYEGIDESRALYEWEYAKQLLYTQLLKDKVTEVVGSGRSLDDAVTALANENTAFFREEFLLPRPLLAALRSESPVVLLIDEIDKADPEFEAFLLEILSEFQVSIPELGTIRATTRPQVVLTSNHARELSDPLKRRCLHLSIPLPTRARELSILRAHLPDIDATLAGSVVDAVQKLREMDLRKLPSIGETIDWARALAVLGKSALDVDVVRETLGVLLKHQADLDKVTPEVSRVLS